MKSIESIKKEATLYRKTTSRSDLGTWKVETKRPLVEELQRQSIMTAILFLFLGIILLLCP